MKKNKMMRLASVLLVCVLLTTSVISGTFAKYITTDQQFDTARVAKWGVVASMTGDLFGATYNAVADDNSITTYSKNGGTVSSADKAFVVAPGTENMDGLTISVSGIPEVSTKVIFDFAEDETGIDYKNSDIYLNAGTYGYMTPYTGEVTKENIIKYYIKTTTVQYRAATADDYSDSVELYELHGEVKATENYYPLTWKVVADSTTEGIKSITEVVDALKTEFAGKEFKPNEDNALKAIVTWSWAYGKAWGDTNGTAEYTVDSDLKDTILGNMMAGNVDMSDNVKDDALDVVKKNGTVYYAVEYQTETVGANTVVYAYANSAKVACLTVAFNARLTVEQVD